MFKASVITVVTIAAATLIIIRFITFTSSSDCKVIINDSDYETTGNITELIIYGIDNQDSKSSKHKHHLLEI